MSTLHHEATYDDLLAVPDHLVAEIVEGELFTSPRPAFRHSRATNRLAGLLDDRFDRGISGPGGWWLVVEPELHLGKDVLVPDIAGWHRERMPEFPSGAWSDVAPDWICETVSVKTARLDRERKLPRYARHGIPHAWIVDPVARRVEVYRREGEQMLLLSTHEGSIRTEPFDACELDLSALWV